MIIGKNFFITEIPKTGTSFLRNYFEKYKDVIITTHHDTVEHNKNIKLLKKKYKIGIIRSPYAWYLSYWRWSCLQKKISPLYNDLTSRRIKIRRLKLNLNLFNYIISQATKKTTKLKSLFLDINSKKNFNKFLDILLNAKFKNYISSDFSFIPYQDLGYMSHFFFYQNLLRKDYNILFENKKNFKKMIKVLDSKIFTNYYFRTENLTNDLKIFLRKNKIKVKNFKDLDRNTSSKKLDEDYIQFFTKKNLVLIENKENYLFKKFNYKKISKY